MPDPAFEEKGKSLNRGLKNTLALRVVSITVCFIILPIIALSFILYIHEYEQKKESNFFALDLVAHEMQDVVSGFIEQNITISETLEYLLNQPGSYSSQKSRAALNALFHSLSANEAVSDILYLQQEGKGYYCTISSSQKYLGMNFSFLFNEAPFQGKKNIFFSHQLEKTGADILISAHPLYRASNDEPYGVILICMSPRLFGSKLEFATNNQLPISTSILTESGRVIASTRMEFLQKRFAIQGQQNDPKVFREKERGPIIPLDPVGGGRENYVFDFEGNERMAVYLPLQDTQHGVLIEMSDTVNLVPVSAFLLRMLLLFFIIFLSGIIGTIWLTYRVVRPLKNLCSIMLHVQRGNRHERYKKDRWGFEINVVGKIFNSMLDAFEQQVKEIRKERNEKELLTQELLLGQKIQTSLLPRSLPEVPSVRMATGFISAKEVGGDFYDVLLREVDGKKQVLFSIADASGKGVYACLFSLSVRSMMRSGFMKGYSLDEIVRDTNNLFYIDAESTSAFVTAWIGILDVASNTLTFANCGHHPAFRTSQSGVVEKLHTSNIALGVLPLDEIEIETVSLEKGDGIVLFTDGVVEAHNKDEQLFGEDRLIEIIKKHSRDPKELVATIVDDVRLFSKGVHQHDDLTILSILINP